MFRVKSSPDKGGAVTDPRPIEWSDVLDEGYQVRRFKPSHLSEKFQDRDKKLTNPLKKNFPDARFISQDWSSQAFYTWGDESSAAVSTVFQCLRGGQREQIYWDPKEVNAAIVNCGGLCPGLNSVIRELTMMLHLYGVNKVFGIIGGYKGVMEPENWIELTPEVVQDIHLKGGSFLVSDRGNPPHHKMAEMFREHNVRQIFIIGGDGTHKGATTIYEEASGIEGQHTIPGKALNPAYECSVVGIPKTIDNDIALLDFTFGFHSAVDEAVRAIDAAYVESSGNANCLGLVKLMGRSSGFIALEATLAARNVDLCLIPEMEIDMDKVLEYLVGRMTTQNHTVVVIAEGLGDTLIKGEGFDAGGNKKLADVGPWFKKQVEAHFKEKGLPLSIKYIDPSYQVRAVPPDPFDSVYCSVLAQNAVHAAMAGYTGITVGKIDENYVVLPIQAITELPSKIVDVQGKLFSRMLVCTNQPPLGPDDIFSKEDAVAALPRDEKRSRAASRRSSLYSRQATESFGGSQMKKKSYLSDPLGKEDVFMAKDVITRYELQHLSTREPGANVESPFEARLPGVVRYKNDNSWSTTSVWKRDDETKGSEHCQFLRGGPREVLYWDPTKVKAAIVNCGGICPGLNSVIRELVRMLDFYGCTEVYGIIGGYKGVMEPESWMKLTPKYVEEMHLKGGSFLISDRGNPPHIEMAKMYKAKGITHVYIIGGDGTHKGVMQTYEQMLNIDYKCSMCGIPKTIDNDIALLDFTFGFHTAVDKAVEAIDAAYVEAECNANCMGLVKLMGRHAGFIAQHACLAARNVDLCLVPEMDIDMETVKEYIAEMMEKRPHCVVVIAEGLGDTLIKAEGADAGGNKTLADVGPWFKKQVEAHMKALKRPFTCKYIDPSYMIRASPPDSFDSVYCSNLAMAAVNGCFAGYTGFTVGKISNHYVMIPIDEITGRKSKTIHLGSHWFSRMVYTTKQPSMATRPGSAKAAIQSVLEETCRKNDDGTGHVEKSLLKDLLTSVGMSGDHVDTLLAHDAFGSNGKIHYGKLTAWLAA